MESCAGMNDRPTDFDFFVFGVPAPGGSKSAFILKRKDGSLIMRKGTNHPIVNVVDSGGKRTKEWRKAVAVYAKASIPPGFQPSPRAVHCRFNFWMPRPQDEFNSAGQLKEWAEKFHLKPPDALKLARSTEDALTGIIWQDDKQVVSGSQSKQYVLPGEKVGCRIRITFL